MNDRALLEAAARAAGLEFKWREGDPKWGPEHVGPAAFLNGCWQSWNPLDDDARALQLAVKCGEMRLLVDEHGASARIGEGGKWWGVVADSYVGIEAATRRVIVLAAAAIGSERG